MPEVIEENMEPMKTAHLAKMEWLMENGFEIGSKGEVATKTVKSGMIIQQVSLILELSLDDMKEHYTHFKKRVGRV